MVFRLIDRSIKQPAGHPSAPGDMQGLLFRPVDREEFDRFTVRQATSPETGRIGTVFDQDKPAHPDQIIRTLGLFGCDKLCAVAVCVIVPNKSDDHNSCRLDTVVVDHKLRRQGLATLAITKLFLDLLSEPGLDISRLFSYAVHPATVSALKNLQFSEPPPKGAPLVSVDLGDTVKPEVLTACQTLFGKLNAQLLGMCSACRTVDEPDHRWCEPENSATGK